MATATALMNTGMMTMPTGSEMAPATGNNAGNNWLLYVRRNLNNWHNWRLDFEFNKRHDN